MRKEFQVPGRNSDLTRLGLTCTRCGGALTLSGRAFRCENADHEFPYDERIVRFIEDDSFYEGNYENTIRFLPTGKPSSVLRHYFINTHYLWWFAKYIEQGSRLLDLGCAGGVDYFAKNARAVALDLSRSSLRHLSGDYVLGVQADATNIPFRDGAFDTITSAYFYEHIASDTKEDLLRELRRVLRPGGRMLFLFDVLSDNPLFRWLRSDEKTFDAAFIRNDGHYGLEAASVNLNRFERSGFRVLRTHVANKTPIQHLPVLQWMGKYDTRPTRIASRLGTAISNSPIANKMYTVSVTLMDDLLEPLLPTDWGRIMLVLLEKA